jgi:RND superfamily putative drug exporter
MAVRFSPTAPRHAAKKTPRRSRGGLLQSIATLAIAAPRRTLAVAALVMAAAGVFGIPVAQSLSAGGFADPTSESARATKVLTDKFGLGDMQLLFGARDERDLGMDRAACRRSVAGQQG